MTEAKWQSLLTYVEDNLGGDLSIGTVSDVVGCSPFHFHRQFSSRYGQTFAALVRRQRLIRAGWQLAYRAETSVTDIAFDAGFQSLEAFSRAFKQALNASPSQFRQQPNWQRLRHFQQQASEVTTQMAPPMVLDPQIEQHPSVKVYTLLYQGPPSQLGNGLRDFIQWRQRVGLSPRISRTFNLLYDDPAEVPPQQYRFGICAEATAEVPIEPDNMLVMDLPEGRCARVRITGGDEQLAPAVQWLYRHWLPQSGENAADFPLFLERLNLYPEVPPHRAAIDLFLPLQS